MKPRIAIIGGGVSGLAAAYELSRRGQNNFSLYEASPRLGGIVETQRRGSFVIECGPDSWVTEKPWARELAVELGLESEIISSNDANRRTYLAEDNQLIAMPDDMRMMVPGDLEAIERSPLFSERAKKAYREEPARAQELRAHARARTADEDESVARFVERHFGREVAETIAAPLLSGVFGGDIRTLSADAVLSPFLKMEREHGSLVLALREKQRRQAIEAPVFTTLKSGLQTLIDAMGAAIPAAALHLSQRVLAMGPKRQGWEVTTASGVTSFDQVVLATPVHVARELIAPWNPELAGLLNMDSTSAIIAAFAFDRKQSLAVTVPEGFGFLVPPRAQSQSSSKEPELLAGTFVNQKFSHRAPEGCILLRAFFGGSSAPSLLAESDEFILSAAHKRLSAILEPLPEACFTLVRRWPQSLPQYTVGHMKSVARIEACVREISGLRLIGNALHGVGLPDLIRQGRSVATEIAS